MDTRCPDEIVILDQPGEMIYPYPEWARWCVVTVRGADGGNGSCTPGEKGNSTTVSHEITSTTVSHEITSTTARVVIGLAGRDFDGVRRNQNAYVLLELYR